MTNTPSRNFAIATWIAALLVPATGCAVMDGIGGYGDYSEEFEPPAIFPPDDPESDSLFAARRAFVTRTGRAGDLGGLIGADLRCQEQADAANLGGTWMAWLADDFSSPATRFVQGLGPYVRLDGALIAIDWDDLVDGVLSVPINKAFDGSTVAEGEAVWSNVASDGTRQGQAHCSDWNIGPGAPSTGLVGRIGREGQSDQLWTSDANIFPCDFLLRFYCFEQ